MARAETPGMKVARRVRRELNSRLVKAMDRGSLAGDLEAIEREERRAWAAGKKPRARNHRGASPARKRR